MREPTLMKSFRVPVTIWEEADRLSREHNTSITYQLVVALRRGFRLAPAADTRSARRRPSLGKTA
jgi:hypothetical protein